ncbi:MAG TPA: hypothetical protein VGT41_05405 [Candidatus Babeliales bacterium]|nr:hypothetical protein [Candidatus Babeliales bacterium]
MKKIFLVANAFLGIVNTVVPSQNDLFCDVRPIYNDNKHSWGTLSVGADWKFWRLESHRMDLGAELFVTDAASNKAELVDTLRPRFRATNGYKVVAAYTCPRANLQIEASFTHIPVCADFNRWCPQPSIVFLGIGFPILSFISNNQMLFRQAHMQWRGKIECANLDFVWEQCISGKVTNTASIGLEALIVDQHAYISGDTDNARVVANLEGTLKGGGVKFGWSSDRYLGHGFSLRAGLASSIICTQSRGKACLEGFDALSGTVKSDQWRIVPVSTLGFFCGFGYAKDWCRCSIDTYLGFEQKILLEANLFSGGTIYLQGLTLGCVYSF